MATRMTSTLPPDIVPTLPEDRLLYAAKVHTFESFGRAIVEAALKQSAKAQSGAMPATVSILPSRRATDVPAGGHAKGTVAPDVCLIIAITIGGDEAHYYELCI